MGTHHSTCQGMLESSMHMRLRQSLLRNPLCHVAVLCLPCTADTDGHGDG